MQNVPLKLTIVITLTGVAIGFIGGYQISVERDRSHHARAPHAYSERQSGYEFINPLLECESAEGRLNDGLIPFKKDIEQIVEQEKDMGHIESAAVYFRDLNNGPWFGINEREEFLPASLLKLPLMLNFYKLAESKPEILKEKILFTTPFQNTIQRYPPSRDIEVGKEYTIEELVEYMIVYSSNQATELLYTNAIAQLKAKGFLENAPAGINSDLRYLADILGENKETLNTRNYATFFRILFNASYLDRELSEQALRILSRADFKKGLVAGVPRDIQASHKFGEAGSSIDVSQLHDCGIIYYPKAPYVLCVMTKGKDWTLLPAVISRISEETYRQVSRQK